MACDMGENQTNIKGKNIEEILRSLIGHKISIRFTHYQETEMRETFGILVDVTNDIIHMKIYNEFGEQTDYYLNRHACNLHSVSDEGKADNV